VKPIWVIAKNTYREIIRDRILYGLFVFAILLISLSLALGQLSFAEQTRITINFGFTAIHLSAAILSIFVGSTLVGREIEKKTILTLLARPVSRTQFIVGKSFGLMAVIFVAVALLSLVLSGILFTLNLPITGSFLVGVYGILLEAAILLSLTLFFGTFASPMLSVSFSIGIFLVGHWLESMKYFADKSESQAFKFFTKTVRSVLPNLESFNWRSLFVYGDAIPVSNVMTASVYALSWGVFLVTVSALILRRRDLG
jgi:Cu-processing system permease protein